MATPGPDLSAIKQRQQQMWAAGDFDTVAIAITIVGELLCEAVDPSAGQRALDVACGSGNTAIAAARRRCEVTGVDFVPSLIERARERANAEHLAIDVQVGDAENLPFPDASFDLVLSTFGAMFAPRQEQTAAEMLRVCAPGGKIGMANWTPEGWVGQFFRVVQTYVPAPPGVPSPLRWGTEAGLRELFGDRGSISDLRLQRRAFTMRYVSAETWLTHFRTSFGPTNRAFAGLDEEGQTRLAAALIALANDHNIATDGTLKVRQEYLEVVATKA